MTEEDFVVPTEGQEAKKEDAVTVRDLIADAGGNDIEIEFYYKGKLVK